MPPPQQPQPDNWNVSLAQSLGLTYNLVTVLVFGVLPFLRHQVGPRGFDPHIVGTMILLLLLAGSYPVFLIYGGFWLCFVVFHRVKSWKLNVHSQYQGFPWLAMRLPFVKTEEGARYAEPLICVVAGVLLIEVSEQLALFLFVGAAAIVVKGCFEEIIEKLRLRGMRDSEIEMDYYTEKYRRR